jgi:pimeloyl-ACP methyl ester carboxylesterase
MRVSMHVSLLTLLHVRCWHPSADAPIVLFLHGAKYTSENWVNLGTLSLLNSKGYRTIAVDLPGNLPT